MSRLQPSKATGAGRGVDAGLTPPPTNDAEVAPDDRVFQLLSRATGSSLDGVCVLRPVRDDSGRIDEFECETVPLVAGHSNEVDPADEELDGSRLVDDGDVHVRMLFDVARTGVTRSGAMYSTTDAVNHRIQYTARRVSDDGAVVVVARDVSEHDRVTAMLDQLQQANQTLERQALHDPLTGVANRLLLESRLEHGISRLERRDTSLAVVFIDLDGFKDINDRFGHAAGDAVLIEVGRRLTAMARHADTVSRVGGDEFVVVLEDVRHNDVDQIAQRLLSICGAPVIVAGCSVDISASIGVAVTSTAAAEPAALFHTADIAMYQAKADGGGRVGHSHDEVSDRVLRRHAIEIGIQQAIEDGALVVSYEPIARADDGRRVATQARIHWDHPHYGLIDDASLDDAARKTGMIEALGEQVIEHAVATQARAAADDDRGEFVVVNIHAALLGDLGFVDRLANTLHRHRLNPAALCVAVAGDDIADHENSPVNVFEQLAALGVRIMRDAVGAPDQALTYFGDLPIDFIRLDPSLIDRLCCGDTILIGLIHEAAHAANRTIIATAVRSVEQVDALRALGTHLVQGEALDLGPADRKQE